MENQAIFQERQKFTSMWIWIPFIGLVVFLLLKMTGINTMGTTMEALSPSAQLTVVGFGLSMLSIAALLSILQLDTRIDEKGISRAYFPFLSEKTYSWDDISEAYIRKYSPLMEYGGWGIRFSLFGKGWAYNVGGNQGLQLILKDGKKILIGTQRPVAMQKVLDIYLPADDALDEEQDA